MLAFVRSYGDERILVVANLSRYVEYVELDLSAYQGMVAVELFSGRPFPPIGALPYLLTLGPHSFYWFRLETAEVGAGRPLEVAPSRVPLVRVRETWENAFQGEGREALEAALPAILRERRWFGGKAQADPLRAPCWRRSRCGTDPPRDGSRWSRSSRSRPARRPTPCR